MESRPRPPQEAQILLVEDNPEDIRLIKESFNDGQINNNLHIVNDGQEALDFIYREGEYKDAPRPDIVLLDLRLPKVDGEDVLHKIKHYPELEEFPSLSWRGSMRKSSNHRTSITMQTKMQSSKSRLIPVSLSK